MPRTFSLPILAFLLAVTTSACSLLDERTPSTEHEYDKHADTTRASDLERVPDSLLVHVPPANRAGIEEARVAESRARDDWAAAQRATQTSRNRLALARQDLEIAQAEMKKAELAASHAETGTQDEMDRCRRQVEDARALIEASRERIAWREREIESAEAHEELRRAEQSLAAAQVEMAKARAVQELDRPEARKVSVSRFERVVRLEEERVSIAQVKYEAAQKEVRIARGLFEDKSKAVPASYKRDWNDTELVSNDKQPGKP